MEPHDARLKKEHACLLCRPALSPLLSSIVAWGSEEQVQFRTRTSAVGAIWGRKTSSSVSSI
jgi:hypothetical protein